MNSSVVNLVGRENKNAMMPGKQRNSPREERTKILKPDYAIVAIKYNLSKNSLERKTKGM
jgi:hypothetical protein